MNEWARRDALRALRRLDHLRGQDEPADADELAYLAALLRITIYGPFAHTLPDGWPAKLERVVALLEGHPPALRLLDGNGNGNGNGHG